MFEELRGELVKKILRKNGAARYILRCTLGDGGGRVQGQSGLHETVLITK